MRRPNFLGKVSKLLLIVRFFQIFATFSENLNCIVAFHKESQSFLTKHSYFLLFIFFTRKYYVCTSVFWQIFLLILQMSTMAEAPPVGGDRKPSLRELPSYRKEANQVKIEIQNDFLKFWSITVNEKKIFTKCLMIPVGWNCSCAENENH